MINKHKLYSISLVSAAMMLGLISIEDARPQSTPGITLDRPAKITYAIPLSSTQLDASASDTV